MLERLKRERVISVKRAEGGLRIREACDNYFAEVLSPCEVRELCAELLALVATGGLVSS